MKAGPTVAILLFFVTLVMISVYLWFSRPRTALLIEKQLDREDVKRPYKLAIATLASVENQKFSEFTVPALQHYCKTQEYDLLIYRQARRTLAHLLVHALEADNYEYVVYVSSHILFTKDRNLDGLLDYIFNTHPSRFLAMPEDCYLPFACNNISKGRYDQASYNSHLVICRRNALEPIKALLNHANHWDEIVDKLEASLPTGITCIGHNLIRQSSMIKFNNTDNPILGVYCQAETELAKEYQKIPNRFNFSPVADLLTNESLLDTEPLKF